MAMLAEPRRKQRIGPNPRGKFFAEQDKNVGKELLEKMGWRIGEGLGLDRQGISEPIKPKIQMTSKGVGYDPKENPWIEHNLEFEEILRGLNAETSSGPVRIKAEPEEQEDQEVGTTPKKRKHRYHKVLKSKDLSRASSQDLRSILGTSVSSQGFSSAVSSENHNCNGSTITVKEEKDGNTVNKGSMVDYFREKMEQKRLKDSLAEVKSEFKKEKDPEVEVEERKKESEVEVKTESSVKPPEPEEDDAKMINRGSMVDYFKRKMEAKRLTAAAEQVIAEKREPLLLEKQEVNEEQSTESAEVPNDKIRKPRKRNVTEIELEPSVIVEDTSIIHKPKRKKKSKKPVSLVSEDTELQLTQVDSTVESEFVQDKKRKKKKEKLQNEAYQIHAEQNLQDVQAGQSDASLIADSAPKHEEVAPEITLEEQLKREMENLKNGKRLLRHQYFSSLNTVGKKFKGSNIDKVKGYTLY